MRKLRNIYYLRFGSKIRQGFAVATPSLTPPLSLPLCGCRGKKMRGRGSSALLYRGGACRPLPGGSLAYRPASGRQAPPRGQNVIKCKFLKKLFARKPLAGACRPPGGRQAPQSCIKGFPSPSPLICFPWHPESGRERGGVRERVVTAKPCWILDPNRR